MICKWTDAPTWKLSRKCYGVRDQERCDCPGIPRDGIVVCPNAKKMSRKVAELFSAAKKNEGELRKCSSSRRLEEIAQCCLRERFLDASLEQVLRFQ